MGKIVWDPLALDDMQRIAENIRVINPLKEQQFLGDIIGKTEQLERYPYSGQKVNGLAATDNIRTLLVTKSLRLLYQVLPNEDVYVLQVLDLRSDRPFYR